MRLSGELWGSKRKCTPEIMEKAMIAARVCE